VQQLSLGGAEKMLDLPTEYATVPSEQLKAIVDWLGPRQSEQVHNIFPVTKQEAQLAIGGVPITECEVRLAEYQLVGIESRPQDVTDAATVVFLNSGSEPHLGPGRAWVELSRQLAAAGHRAIRIDFRGWGESPDCGFAPGRPYDHHTVQDTHAIVAALRERGDRKIVLVGVCAGAWVALYECGNLPVSGIVAFNPQLYWQQGDPVLATMVEAERWLVDVQATPGWQGRPAAVSQWFLDICQAGKPIDFWFAKNDPGIRYIREQLSRSSEILAQSKFLNINELSNLDHSMHRHWFRLEAFNAISGMLQRIVPS
jgi:pimeloyl-ACP methyl ester carboxylesterase